LGELQRFSYWWWLPCERCRHSVRTALAAPIILWGADAPSDVLRQGARYTAWGGKLAASGMGEHADGL
jgi:hypothetical protein